MNSLDLDKMRDYVNENIVSFHRRRLKSLEDLSLDKLLRKTHICTRPRISYLQAS